jgi:hypothetical protein
MFEVKLLKNINKKYFILFTILFTVLTFISFMAAWSEEEGTIGKSKTLNLFAYLFNVFRFPTHNLFWNWISGELYFVGLVINSMFYGLISERIINLIIKNKTTR